MDGNRFDALSRAMAVAGSRRRVIRALAGIAAGGAVASLEVDQAGARPARCRPGGRYCTWNHQCCNNKCRTGKRYPWRTRNVCECMDPDGWCGNVCTKLGTDKRNCGSCGHKCLPGEVCHDGQCWRQLGQTCERDNIHDHECEPDLTCEHNRKVCVGPYQWVGCLDDDDNCDHDLVCRDNTCLPPGELTQVCEQDSDCGEGLLCDEETGECVPACTPAFAACTTWEECCGSPDADCVPRTNSNTFTVGAAPAGGTGDFCCLPKDTCSANSDCCYSRFCETNTITNAIQCADYLCTGCTTCTADSDCSDYNGGSGFDAKCATASDFAQTGMCCYLPGQQHGGSSSLCCEDQGATPDANNCAS
jgi:hypothetical protein